MAESTVTETGLDELRAGVNQLPAAVTLALQRVAEGSANRVLMGARQRLLSPNPPLKRGRESTAANVAALIEIIEDLPNKQYIVSSQAPAGNPANTVLWIEYGSVHQAARPYMHPAADAENASYQTSMEDAAVSEAQKVFA